MTCYGYAELWHTEEAIVVNLLKYQENEAADGIPGDIREMVKRIHKY
uniref:Uncharacterized protein n=1 Tax=Arundo donax TaxID=35708 RepID=A0A0A9BSQ2_ARUDO